MSITDPQAVPQQSEETARTHDHDALAFGSFVLHPRRHQLFRHGEQVQLGSRALDLLIALATHAGELVEKDQLIACAWPKVVVEECNLRAQIVALRRVLKEDGNDCIATVPGRGYRFIAATAPVHEQPAVATVRTELRQPALPATIRETIGRDEIIDDLCGRVRQDSRVTLTGPGGIGKTTVALAVARRVEASFELGVRFVDLSEVNGYANVQAALVTALGLTASASDAWEQALNHLQQGTLLLVLDNCEHLLDAVTEITETLRQQAPQCHILATSREPLQLASECVERLQPLQLPQRNAPMDRETLLRSPAARLFIERVQAQDSGFELHDEDSQAIALLCHLMDGVPLELEIAAARVSSFGIHTLLDMLGGDFRLQMEGRRTAAKRHRSMRAVLDWSYVGLTPPEQAVLRLTSIFTGPFTFNAVKAIVEGETILSDEDCQAIVDSLVEKSLLLAEHDGSTRYRMLGTTRLYAMKKLEQTGATQRAISRHAAYALEVVRRAAGQMASLPDAWRSIHAAESDIVRSALAHVCSTRSEQSPSLELKLAALGLLPKRTKLVPAPAESVPEPLYRLA